MDLAGGRTIQFAGVQLKCMVNWLMPECRKMLLPRQLSTARSVFAVALLFFLVGCVGAQVVESASTNSVQGSNAVVETVVLPKSVPDPLEPMNRVLWAVNKGILIGAVKPTGKVYRAVVGKPMRNGIKNIGVNITYPQRLINNLLQGKWGGAGDETLRFLCNSTMGLGGFFDVATQKKIPKSDADFGQTLGKWGWHPHFYLMLPIFGPSNDRDAVGFAADTAANPLTYLSPYSSVETGPWTYISPYTYISYGITYNNLTDTVDSSVRLIRTEQDAYSELQYAWTFVRANRVADFQVEGKQDESSLETLQSVFFTFKDPEFPNRGKTRSVLIPATGKKLKFTYWLQPGKAPVVYIVPGLGSHRLVPGALALAELVYQKGFSAVTISSPYNYEFMDRAATTAMPAYSPVDAHDLHVALTRIDQRLTGLYPDRLGSRALMGYSMGAFHTLFIAGTEATNQEPLVKFDRFVAINTPVRLLYGISKLDEFYRAPLAWPAAERTTNIDNTFLKVAALSQASLTPPTSLPFSAIESKFLVGLTFRFLLRDVIYASQARNNQGILHHRISSLRRNPVYQEILQYSFMDYFNKFVTPYYKTRGIDLTASDTLEKASDLRTYAAALQANHDVRLILDRNDFLLPAADLAWLQATFAPSQIALFERGGHLGELAYPFAQKAILDALDGLEPAPKGPK